MFPKMGSCVSERVRVSLVKEASDTGGIPSPRELRSGIGTVCAQVCVRLVTSAGKVHYKERDTVPMGTRTRGENH